MKSDSRQEIVGSALCGLTDEELCIFGKFFPALSPKMEDQLYARHYRPLSYKVHEKFGYGIDKCAVVESAFAKTIKMCRAGKVHNFKEHLYDTALNQEPNERITFSTSRNSIESHGAVDIAKVPPADPEDEALLFDRLSDAFNMLESEDAALLTAYFVRKQNVLEIALMLDLSCFEVRQRIYRARTRIWDAIEGS